MSQNIEKSQKLSVSCINKKMKFLSPHYSGGYKFYQQVWKKKLLNIPIKYITKNKYSKFTFSFLHYHIFKRTEICYS